MPTFSSGQLASKEEPSPQHDFATTVFFRCDGVPHFPFDFDFKKKKTNPENVYLTNIKYKDVCGSF